MVALLSETEGDPAAWPAVVGHYPDRDTGDDPTVDPAVTWKRVESWIGWRWPARSVVWIVDGPGEFTPRLQPFTLSTVEQWDGEAWVSASATPGPLGYVLADGVWRLTGTAGDDSDTPEAVLEAFRRLHEFSHGVARSWWHETATYRSDDHQAVAAWAAKAIHLSGAADLLRPYRRLGA